MYVRIGARRDKRPKSLKLEGKGRNYDGVRGGWTPSLESHGL